MSYQVLTSLHKQHSQGRHGVVGVVPHQPMLQNEYKVETT
jgi:hypothetical protein